MNRKNEPTAGPDQTAAAGRFVLDRWGDHCVEMFINNAIYGSRSYVVWEVHFLDGGHAHFLMDAHSNIELIGDDEDASVAARGRLEARIAEHLVRITAPVATAVAP